MTKHNVSICAEFVIVAHEMARGQGGSMRNFGNWFTRSGPAVYEFGWVKEGRHMVLAQEWVAYYKFVQEEMLK